LGSTVPPPPPLIGAACAEATDPVERNSASMNLVAARCSSIVFDPLPLWSTSCAHIRAVSVNYATVGLVPGLGSGEAIERIVRQQTGPLEPNPRNPRRTFSDEALKQLAESNKPRARTIADACRMRPVSVTRFLGPVLADDRAAVSQTEDVGARRPKRRLLSARRHGCTPVKQLVSLTGRGMSRRAVRHQLAAVRPSGTSGRLLRSNGRTVAVA
jgi:hypothetical protein